MAAKMMTYVSPTTKTYLPKEMTKIGREMFGLDETWHCNLVNYLPDGENVEFRMIQRDENWNWVNKDKVYKHVMSLL